MYAPDLSSGNPLKRLKANLSIASKERKRKRLAKAIKRREFFDNIKRFLFDFFDTVQALFETLLKAPEQIEESMLATQYSVQKTIVQIQKTPDTLQQIVDDTKKSVAETQRATMQAVANAQAVPKRVTASVEEVVADVQAKKQDVEKFVQKVEHMTNEVKYMTGLEQRPPPPPRPPRTAEELAKDVAIEVAKGTASLAGKAGVVVATGTAGMAVSGAKLAWQAATSSDKKEQPSQDEAPSKAMPGRSVTEADMMDTPKTIAEIDPSLEKEVVEALRVAEEALAVPEVGTVNALPQMRKKPTTVGPQDIDINEAVKRAKTAAAQAKKDAKELAEMLNERQVLKK